MYAKISPKKIFESPKNLLQFNFKNPVVNFFQLFKLAILLKANIKMYCFFICAGGGVAIGALASLLFFSREYLICLLQSIYLSIFYKNSVL